MAESHRAISGTDSLPSEPIDRIVQPLARFLHVEAASGIVLLLFTVAALALANSPLADAFLGFWKIPAGFSFGDFELHHPLKHWINDGLMVVFFFVVGLEVKREMVFGELRNLRQAMLPFAAALGGMAMPAFIYLALQYDGPGARGWGIPMATDIAFVVGCVALLGARVPHSLRILLLTLAIIDDIGAILVIAIGYSSGIHWPWLAAGGSGIVLVYVCQRLGVRSFGVYTLLGAGVWFAFHESGVHATIAGVILGILTPARSYINEAQYRQVLDRARATLVDDFLDLTPDLPAKIRRLQWVTREVISPLEYLLNKLHPWVAFMIMPLFAFANAGVPIQVDSLTAPTAIAVILGLLLGKPLGVLGASWLAVRLGWTSLPASLGWSALIGGGLLAGIGFTMALFIASLALQGDLLDIAKIGVLVGSFLSALIGMMWLFATLPRAGAEAQSVR